MKQLRFLGSQCHDGKGHFLGVSSVELIRQRERLDCGELLVKFPLQSLGITPDIAIAIDPSNPGFARISKFNVSPTCNRLIELTERQLQALRRLYKDERGGWVIGNSGRLIIFKKRAKVYRINHADRE